MLEDFRCSFPQATVTKERGTFKTYTKEELETLIMKLPAPTTPSLPVKSGLLTVFFVCVPLVILIKGV